MGINGVETEIIEGETLIKGSRLRPVQLWPIERVCIPELALILWECLHPGQYPSVVDEEQAKYIAATEQFLAVLAANKNVGLYP